MSLDILEPSEDQPEPNFIVRQYIGSTIHPYTPGTNIPEDLEDTLKNEEDLQEGREVCVRGLMGEWMKGTLKKEESGWSVVFGTAMVGIVEKCEDDRDCYICGSFYNAEVIKRIKFTD